MNQNLPAPVARFPMTTLGVSNMRYGGYSGYVADPDGHPWEVVAAAGIELGEDWRVHAPD